jgi:DNA-binding MarR family transcriptional regulator
MRLYEGSVKGSVIRDTSFYLTSHAIWPTLSPVTRAIGRLEREIRQTRPFASPSQEGVVALFRTADLLRRSLTRLVEPHGITLQQYNVLRILRGAGEAGLPTLDIAGRMIEHSPGATRLVDRLVAKGLVRRERCPRDRRQVLCWITPSGLDLLATLDQPIQQGDDAFFAPLAAAEMEGFLHALEALRDAQVEPTSDVGKETT